MKLLFIFVFAALLLPGQSPELRPLLEKTAHKYTGLNAYLIEIEKTTTGHLVTADISPGIQPPLRITLARSGTLLRCEARGPNVSVLWLSDGEQTWDYLRDLNEYTVTPSPPWENIPADEHGLQHMDWEYVSKFRALPGFVDRATLLQASVPADKKCVSETSLIRIDTGTRRQPATETLRIYTDSGLVCSSHSEATWMLRGSSSMYIKSTHWDYKQTSEPIDKDLFRFVPSRKAKLVKQFSRPAQ